MLKKGKIYAQQTLRTFRMYKYTNAFESSTRSILSVLHFKCPSIFFSILNAIAVAEREVATMENQGIETTNEI